MQFYDGVMLVVMIGAVLLGYFKGLAWQVASIGSLVLSYFVSYQFRDQVATYIQAAEPWNKFAAMLVLYLGTMLAVWIAFRFVKDFIEKVKLKEFDRHAGALVGALKGAIVCLLITLFALTLLGTDQKKAIATSHSGRIMAQVIENLPFAVPEEVSGALAKLRNELEHPSDGTDATAVGPDGSLAGNVIRLGSDYLNRQPTQDGAGGAGQGGLPFSVDGLVQGLARPSGSGQAAPAGGSFWPAPAATAPGTTVPATSEDLRREIDDFFRRQEELSRSRR